MKRLKLFNRQKRVAKKVLLIGWDAADWKVITPLLDSGQMPNLERLINNGVMGNIVTLDPPLSPMLWTSAATGKTADKHGVLGFVQPDTENNRLRPVLGTTRKVKAVWNILNQKGYNCNVVGWWPSHPAEPLNGVTVSNFYHRATGKYGEEWPLSPDSVHPKRLEETLAELRVHPGELTAAHILPFVPHGAEAKDEQDHKLINAVAKNIADCATVHAAATWIMENEPWDFMAVYYDAIDHFGHGFMKFHPPRRDFIAEDKFHLFHYVMTAAYRFHDMMLGRLMALAGPDTTIILMSDHGFHSDHLRPFTLPKQPAGPAAEHRKYGIFCISGPGIIKDERIYGASLLDIAPTILTMFNLPIGEDMDGKPLLQAFEQPPKPTMIPSWEDVAGEAGMYPDKMRNDPWAERQMMERLITLGYVEAPTGDQQAHIEKHMRESRFWLARVLIDRNRFAEAITILKELYEQNPDDRRYGLRLADCYRALGDVQKSRLVVEKIIERYGKSFPALDLIQGMLFNQEEQPEKALEYLQRAEVENKENPDLYFHIGRAYLNGQQWKEAEQAFKRVLEIDPDRSGAYHGLSVAYLQQGWYEHAAEAALDSIGLLYFQPATHFHLGEALMALGMYDRAEEAYSVAIQQAPGMRKAYLRLATLCDTVFKRPDEASYYRQFAEQQIQGE